MQVKYEPVYTLSNKERESICDLARSLYYRNQVIATTLKKDPEKITAEFIKRELVPNDMVDWALAIIDMLRGEEYYLKGFNQAESRLTELGVLPKREE